MSFTLLITVVAISAASGRPLAAADSSPTADSVGSPRQPPILFHPRDDLPQLPPTGLVQPWRQQIETLSSARELIGKADYATAIPLIQSVIDSEEDGLVFTTDPDRGIVRRVTSLREMARTLLAELPADGRAFYDLSLGPRFRDEWTAASSTGNRPSLARLFRTAIQHETGWQAGELLARMSADRGDFLTARQLLRRLREIAPDWFAGREGLPRLGAQCERALGHAERSGDWVATTSPAAGPIVATLNPFRPLSAAATAAATPEPAIAPLAPADPQAPVGQPVAGLRRGDSSSEWRTLFGRPSRSGTHTAQLPIAEPLWSLDLIHIDRSDQPLPAAAREVLALWIETLAHGLEDSQQRQAGITPVASPVVTQGLVICRTLDELIACELSTGRVRWRSVLRDPHLTYLFQAQSPDVWKASNDAVESVPIQYLLRRWYEDQLAGFLSTDSNSVFVLEADGPEIGFRNDRVRTQMELQSGSRRLVAYEATTGRLQWDLGGRRRSTQDPFDGLSFVSTPVSVGQPGVDQMLLVIAIASNELRLLALAPPAAPTTSIQESTPQILWTLPLAQLPISFVSEMIPTTQIMPTVAGGLVLCPTQTGQLIAVDWVERRLAWVSQYESRADSDELRDPLRGRIPPRIPATNPNTWIDSVPIVADARVLLAPSDGEQLLAFELDDGRPLWKLQRGGAECLGGVSNDVAVLFSGNEIAAIEVATGVPRWKQPLPPSVSGRGLIIDSSYVLPIGDSELLTLSLATGEPVFRSRIPSADSRAEPASAESEQPVAVERDPDAADRFGPSQMRGDLDDDNDSEQARPPVAFTSQLGLGSLFVANGRLITLSPLEMRIYRTAGESQQLLDDWSTQPELAAQRRRALALEQLWRGELSGALDELLDELAAQPLNQEHASLLGEALRLSLSKDFARGAERVRAVLPRLPPSPLRGELAGRLFDGYVMRGEALLAIEQGLGLLFSPTNPDDERALKPGMRSGSDAAALERRFDTRMISQLRELFAAASPEQQTEITRLLQAAVATKSPTAGHVRWINSLPLSGDQRLIALRDWPTELPGRMDRLLEIVAERQPSSLGAARLVMDSWLARPIDDLMEPYPRAAWQLLEGAAVVDSPDAATEAPANSPPADLLGQHLSADEQAALRAEVTAWQNHPRLRSQSDRKPFWEIGAPQLLREPIERPDLELPIVLPQQSWTESQQSHWSFNLDQLSLRVEARDDLATLRWQLPFDAKRLHVTRSGVHSSRRYLAVHFGDHLNVFGPVGDESLCWSREYLDSRRAYRTSVNTGVEAAAIEPGRRVFQVSRQQVQQTFGFAEDVLIYHAGDELIAAEAATGEVRWIRRDLPQGKYQLVISNRLIAVYDLVNRSWKLLRASDGTVVQLDPSFPDDAILQWVWSGRILVSRRSATDDYAVHSIETGERLWSASFAPNARWAITGERSLLVWEAPASLTLRDLDTGAIRWQTQVPALESPMARPWSRLFASLAGDRLTVTAFRDPPAAGLLSNQSVPFDFARYGALMLGLDVRTGAVRWTTPIESYGLDLNQPPSWPLAVLCVGSTTIINGTSRTVHQLKVLDLNTGERLFDEECQLETFHLRLRPRPDERSFILPLSQQRLRFQWPADGTELPPANNPPPTPAP